MRLDAHSLSTGTSPWLPTFSCQVVLIVSFKHLPLDCDFPSQAALSCFSVTQLRLLFLLSYPESAQ
ncbi:hypothetical protein BaRGS_00015617, partial [Batillaria attramentaria]